MSFRLPVLRALYRKEITDILRDRKTVLMMILLPVVLYPLMFILGVYMFGAVTGSSETRTYQVACTAEAIDAVQECISEYNGSHSFQVILMEEPEEIQPETLGVDVFITKQDAEEYCINYDSSDMDSGNAANVLYDMLSAYRNGLTVKRLTQSGMDAEAILNPIRITYVDKATAQDTMGYLLGMLIPFLMIVSIMMGALYPAIDVTAGERERGTLETLLTLPVSNLELMSGKFLAVSTISMASALLNILSMGGVCLIWYSSIGIYTDKSAGNLLGSFLPALLILVLCMLVFAVFLSAVILCICLNTSSFKEAQNMTTPLMLVVLVLSMAAMLPDIRLEQVAAVPVVNIAVLVRDMFEFEYNFGNIATVLLTNIAYGVIVVVIMSRMYRSERILFAEGMDGIHFFAKRSAILKKAGTLPGIGDAVVLTAVCLLLILTVGAYFQVRFAGVGLLATQLICIGLPLLLAWYIKCDIKKLFSLRLPPKRLAIRQLAGAVLLWAGVYCVMLCLSVWLERWFPTETESLAEMENYLTEMNPVVLAFAVGVAPAVCEEALFRGFLFGTLRGKYSRTVCIIVTAVLFGLYHMSLPRFFTTALLGAASGYALAASGSILLPVLMHMLNNTVSVLAYLLPDWTEAHLPFLRTGFASGKEQALAAVVGVLLAAAGAVLLYSEKDRGNDNRTDRVSGE